MIDLFAASICHTVFTAMQKVSLHRSNEVKFFQQEETILSLLEVEDVHRK